jgi:hypothetical protein
MRFEIDFDMGPSFQFGVLVNIFAMQFWLATDTLERELPEQDVNEPVYRRKIAAKSVDIVISRFPEVSQAHLQRHREDLITMLVENSEGGDGKPRLTLVP